MVKTSRSSGGRTTSSSRLSLSVSSNSSDIKRSVSARHLEPLTTKQRKRLVTRTEANPTHVRELELFTVNDADLYRQQHIPIIKNQLRRMKKGTFDKDKSTIAFMNLADNSARKYTKDFGSGTNIFTKADRLAVAKRLRDDFIEEEKLGNYDNLK